MKRAALVLMATLALPCWLAAQTTVDQKHPAARMLIGIGSI